jgi:hypothetical protein
METVPAERTTELPFLRGVGLIVTYKCQVSCPHCILRSGPRRTEAMSTATACGWIKDIAAYRNGYVWSLALTGGEPFFNLPYLVEISNFASQYDLLVSAVTNAFWASTPGRAIAVLKSVPAIRMLQVSTDVYHLQSIPFDWVRNAILAAQELEIPCTAAVCTENEADPAYQEIIQRLSEVLDRRLIYTAITFAIGRAAETVDPSRYQVCPAPPPYACTAGGSPIIFPDGRVIACIGPVIDLPAPHPLLLGNLNEEPLESIFDRAQSNTILHAVRVWGPGALIRSLQEAGLDDLLQKTYLGNSVCDACSHLMADPRVVSSLEKLVGDKEFQRKVAYARAFFLKEKEMLALPALQG